MVQAGGSAVDAAIAANAVLTVAYPHMCAIGGDLLALVAAPTGEVRAINGSGAAPMRIDVEAIRRSGAMPTTGPLTISVPGTLDAWSTLLRIGGRLDLATVLAPAIALARGGAAVTTSLARNLASHAAVVGADPGLREVLFADGRPLGIGATFRQPALAETLETVASDGVAAFYGGALGRGFTGRLALLGSPLRLDDLAAHRTEVTEPLAGGFRGSEVLTVPPNSQGILLLEMLGALEPLVEQLDPAGEDAALMAEVMRIVSLDRDRWLADPRVQSVPVEALLGPDRLRRIGERALRRIASGERPTDTAEPLHSDTIALTAADSDGWRVVIIQSIFHGFGSGILEPETGILCHNRGAHFSLDPLAANVLAGGKRPVHTLMPVMVRRDGRVTLISGTMGGTAQPQIQAEILGRVLDLGMSPEEALHAPRWVVGGLELGAPSDTVNIESRLAAQAPRFAAHGMPTHLLGAWDEEVGHTHLIAIGDDGELAAATDPRADGSVATLP
jgi:gamma-glutamyltranspeptidase/glutathione hydrolase